MLVEDRITHILKSLSEGNFRITLHCATRMRQRMVTKADIRSCGRTAKSCKYQASRDTYRVCGDDLDGDDLTVVCGLDEKMVVVVTVF